MEVLLHLTSLKLCGSRAQLTFIWAPLGLDTDDGVRANKKGTQREQTTTSEGFSLGPFVSQPPKEEDREAISEPQLTEAAASSWSSFIHSRFNITMDVSVS